jgi:hypothetical protein
VRGMSGHWQGRGLGALRFETVKFAHKYHAIYTNPEVHNSGRVELASPMNGHATLRLRLLH